MKKDFLNNNSKKFKYLLILGGIILFVFTFFPTLGRYKNRTSFYELVEWDGSVASSYRSGSGSEIDPYIISNGSEFAYFAEQLKYTDYKGVYFELSNDIVLNKGLFDYDGTISYTIDDSIYQITEYTNDYDGGSVNEFSSMSEFNGHLNGNSYRIYGLYITSDTKDELAMFESIGGSISDLYISNSMIYGGNNTAMLTINTDNSNLDSENVLIKNVMIDGFVIGNSGNLVTEYDLDDISSGNEINLSTYSYPGSYVFSTLSGVFTPVDETNILTINGNEISSGEFSIELTESDSVSYTLLNEGEYTISNLKYSVTSDYGVASSYVVESNNTDYENVVNKAYVYGKNNASGFIYSSSGNININNAYNIGSIDSSNTSGFITYVNSGEVNLTNVYNNRILNGNVGSLILSVNSGVVNITNSFDTSNNYVINEVNGTVNVENSYSLNSNSIKNGNINGEFSVSDETTMKSSSFITDTLKFNEFVSISDVLVNTENIWVLESDSYPILYIDDLNRPVATINVSIYSWNTLAQDLDSHKFASDFMFSINTTDVLADVKSIEYYLHESTTYCNDLENASFTTYTDVVTVNKEGSYVIYAKITDGDDNILYINSDVLIINSENTIANVTLGDYMWSSVVSVPKYIYLDSESDLVVNVNSEYVDLSNVSYYVTSELLTESELEELSEVWNSYTDKVTVRSNNNNIYYFKIVDNNGLVTYISTDYITVDGYAMGDIVVGRESASNGVFISNKSRISLSYSYSDSNLFVDGYTHNIVSNILLPVGTHITLIDNVNNKIYKYKTDSSSYGYDDVNKKAIYPLNKFNEIGTLETMLLNESVYQGEINENFTIVLDFKDTNFTDEYSSVKVLFEVNDQSGNLVIPTLSSSIKTFSIKSGESSLSISSNFTGYVDYNKDNSNSIDFEIKLKHADDVVDTTSQDKKYGLEIRMVDNDTSSIMGKSYLSNIQFKYNDKTYMPYSNGIVNINLDNSTNGNLIIDTYVNDNKIEGNYSFYVCPYISYDGINYTKVELTNCINVPLNILDSYKVDYKFDIVISGEDRIFLKNQDKTLNFEMLYQSDIENPNVRVSLYEKNELTAYDQTYSLVDLGNYIYDELESKGNKTYSLTEEIESLGSYEMYSLSFKNSLFNMNGYKLVFDLYDGDNKIGSIEKKFIVKGDE